MTTTAIVENKLLRENSIKIVGKLVDAQIEQKVNKSTGVEFVSGKITIVSDIKGESNEFVVELYSNKLTQDKKLNKLYESYSKLPEMVGKKVQVTGEIRENRYYSTNLNQIVSSQKLSGKFVSGVAESAVDMATFTIGGFLVKTPVEKRNQQDEIYRYDVVIGQSNYKGDGMSMITLHINPEQREIVSAVEGLYMVGDTIQVDGALSFVTRTVTKEDTNTAFGAPVTKTFTNKQSNFYIESGSNVITDDRAYSQETVAALINAYKANDVAIQEKEANKAPAAPASFSANAAPAVSKRQASLI